MILEVHNFVTDGSLERLRDNTENVYVCNNLPTTYLESSDTYRLGVKANPSFSGPIDGEGNSRVLTLDAITDGVVEHDGTAVYAALVQDSESRILMILVLDEPIILDGQQVFTTNSISFGMDLVE